MTSLKDLLPSRELGRTGVRVSTVSIGTAFIGSDRDRGSSASDAALAAATAVLSGPFRVVDTANTYGYGNSEIALGQAIRAMGGVPEGTVVVTKAGRNRDTGEYGRDRVLRSFDESAERLGIDFFPLYHLHDPYTMSFEEASGPGGALEALVRLKEEGLVGSLGIAAGTLSIVEQYVDTGLFDVVLTHNRYTLLNRSATPLIEKAAERGMGVINAAPFGGGILAAGASSGGTYAYRAADQATLERVTRLQEICRHHDVPLPAVALQFSLRNPQVDTTLVGTASARRVADFFDLATFDVPEELWREIEALGDPPVDFGSD